ncbi:hypothetical protein BDN71DRAFT_1192033 [Pleurotus eryngii]|uniref:Uncharacterized protein n=1 Tax=Pleurotus eryngii TaxID=5323 RepID=A0A9P6DBA5_PLEER|nr:hypothetical protein BDN71DRAFT_1192033 [Pleurotus eryngii]
MITIVVFFIAAQLLTTLVSNTVVVYLQKVYNILPPRIAKKLGLANTQLASSTLGCQVLTFAVLLIFNVTSLAFFTVYTFTREHTIEVEAMENLNLPADFGPTLIGQLGIAVAYRDAGYSEQAARFRIPYSGADIDHTRIVTLDVELSCIALFLSALTMLATGIAWHKRRVPLPSLPSTQIELGKGEAVVEVMADIEDKDPRSH